MELYSAGYLKWICFRESNGSFPYQQYRSTFPTELWETVLSTVCRAVSLPRISLSIRARISENQNQRQNQNHRNAYKNYNQDLSQHFGIRIRIRIRIGEYPNLIQNQSQNLWIRIKIRVLGSSKLEWETESEALIWNLN